jgi:hypothetical protein
MNVEFYLFDVDHGQSAAVRLEDGRWCLFDVGSSNQFSPVDWMASKAVQSNPSGWPFHAYGYSSSAFYKVTVSHFHADHLYDWPKVERQKPAFIKTVQADQEYIQDSRDSNTDDSWPIVEAFIKYHSNHTEPAYGPDYGNSLIYVPEFSMPTIMARSIGGNSCAKVNNASIVSRISINGYNILICGDIMREAWDAIFRDESSNGDFGRKLVSNVDILVAPHHGHSTAYSGELMNLAKPKAVFVSVQEGDPNVDSRYSGDTIKGIMLADGNICKCLTTRTMGHIKILFSKQMETTKTCLTAIIVGADALK